MTDYELSYTQAKGEHVWHLLPRVFALGCLLHELTEREFKLDGLLIRPLLDWKPVDGDMSGKPDYASLHHRQNALPLAQIHNRSLRSSLQSDQIPTY